MKKTMQSIELFSVAAMFLFGILWRTLHGSLYETLAITFGTVAFHLAIRLAVGELFSIFMKNRADYRKRWYQIAPWEQKLYKCLRVKAWKGKMPTYDPESFSTKTHTWEELAQTMCQAELVHEVNMVLSFVPLIASCWFGAFPVFLITSICAAMYDGLFVVMQRYNRGRILKIIDRKAPNKASVAGL